jgi:FixJ family two-component response regulator
MTFEPLPRFPDCSKLTPKELEVATYLVHGFMSKETARELHISPRTVEDHPRRSLRTGKVQGSILCLPTINEVNQQLTLRSPAVCAPEISGCSQGTGAR